jgi:hypothetical protein
MESNSKQTHFKISLDENVKLSAGFLDYILSSLRKTQNSQANEIFAINKNRFSETSLYSNKIFKFSLVNLKPSQTFALRLNNQDGYIYFIDSSSERLIARFNNITEIDFTLIPIILPKLKTKKIKLGDDVYYIITHNLDGKNLLSPLQLNDDSNLFMSEQEKQASINFRSEYFNLVNAKHQKKQYKTHGLHHVLASPDFSNLFFRAIYNSSLQEYTYVLEQDLNLIPEKIDLALSDTYLTSNSYSANIKLTLVLGAGAAASYYTYRNYDFLRNTFINYLKQLLPNMFLNTQQDAIIETQEEKPIETVTLQEQETLAMIAAPEIAPVEDDPNDLSFLRDVPSPEPTNSLNLDISNVISALTEEISEEQEAFSSIIAEENGIPEESKDSDDISEIPKEPTQDPICIEESKDSDDISEILNEPTQHQLDIEELDLDNYSESDQEEEANARNSRKSMTRYIIESCTTDSSSQSNRASSSNPGLAARKNIFAPGLTSFGDQNQHDNTVYSRRDTSIINPYTRKRKNDYSSIIFSPGIMDENNINQTPEEVYITDDIEETNKIMINEEDFGIYQRSLNIDAINNYLNSHEGNAEAIFHSIKMNIKTRKKTSFDELTKAIKKIIKLQIEPSKQDKRYEYENFIAKLLKSLITKGYLKDVDTFYQLKEKFTANNQLNINSFAQALDIDSAAAQRIYDLTANQAKETTSSGKITNAANLLNKLTSKEIFSYSAYVIMFMSTFLIQAADATSVKEIQPDYINDFVPENDTHKFIPEEEPNPEQKSGSNFFSHYLFDFAKTAFCSSISIIVNKINYSSYIYSICSNILSKATPEKIIKDLVITKLSSWPDSLKIIPTSFKPYLTLTSKLAFNDFFNAMNGTSSNQISKAPHVLMSTYICESSINTYKYLEPGSILTFYIYNKLEPEQFVSLKFPGSKPHTPTKILLTQICVDTVTPILDLEYINKNLGSTYKDWIAPLFTVHSYQNYSGADSNLDKQGE